MFDDEANAEVISMTSLTRGRSDQEFDEFLADIYASRHADGG